MLQLSAAALKAKLEIEVVFADDNPAVVTALAQAFGSRYAPAVRFVVGNVFCQGPGILVSPANSRGDMGGGFDLQLRLRFGMALEAELQATIKRDHKGRLPIGKAVSIATSDPDYPFVIFAPTLGSHLGIVKHPADVRKAAAAAFLTVVGLTSQMEDGSTAQRRVIIPGFGTGMGGLDPVVAGRAVFRGFSTVFSKSRPLSAEDVSSL